MTQKIAAYLLSGTSMIGSIDLLHQTGIGSVIHSAFTWLTT